MEGMFGNTRKLGLVLAVILLVIIVWSRLPGQNKLADSRMGPSPTPNIFSPASRALFEKKFGEFIYYHEGKFFYVSFPSGQMIPLGSKGQEDKIYPAIRPAWSPDGKLLAMVTDETQIKVVEFDSGTLVSTLLLEPKLILSKNISISISPDSKFVLIKQENGSAGNARIYSLEDGKLVLSFENCSYQGWWMTEPSMYVATCKDSEDQRIWVFDPNAPQEINRFVGEKNTDKLVGLFDTSLLLVKRGKNLGTLDVNGQFTAFTSKNQKFSSELANFNSLEEALIQKIKTEKKIDEIDDLVVSQTNTFALYSRSGKIYLIEIPISSDPVLLLPGILPTLRPL